jgi:hypothetical protein
VYLLRESAKVSKEMKDRKMFKLSKRLGAEESKDDVGPGESQTIDKRMKNVEGKSVNVTQRPVAPSQSELPRK